MERSDDNKVTGRLRRYAQVGGAVGGLAGRYATTRLLGLELDRTKHALKIESTLGGLKGPLMKAAQLLATIPDALPADYVQALSRLQANAPAMGWPFVRRGMSA